MVSDCNLEVKVFHPLKIKAIAGAKIKTDKIFNDILAPASKGRFNTRMLLCQRKIQSAYTTSIKGEDVLSETPDYDKESVSPSY